MKALSEFGISPYPWDCHEQYVIANDDGSVVAATNVRDARLIAAAPELYEALRGLLEWRGLRGGDIEEKVETAKEFCSRIAKARAAVAKASCVEVAK